MVFPTRYSIRNDEIYLNDLLAKIKLFSIDTAAKWGTPNRGSDETFFGFRNEDYDEDDEDLVNPLLL